MINQLKRISFLIVFVLQFTCFPVYGQQNDLIQTSSSQKTVIPSNPIHSPPNDQVTASQTNIASLIDFNKQDYISLRIQKEISQVLNESVKKAIKEIITDSIISIIVFLFVCCGSLIFAITKLRQVIDFLSPDRQTKIIELLTFFEDHKQKILSSASKEFLEKLVADTKMELERRMDEKMRDIRFDK